ncbi:hypothetical protein [Ignatzschineria sp. LJL83]
MLARDIEKYASIRTSYKSAYKRTSEFIEESKIKNQKSKTKNLQKLSFLLISRISDIPFEVLNKKWSLKLRIISAGAKFLEACKYSLPPQISL